MGLWCQNQMMHTNLGNCLGMDTGILSQSDKRRVIKRCGHGGVKIIQGIDFLLKNNGFTFCGVNQKGVARYITWSKKLDQDLSQEIELEISTHENANYFTTALSISSKAVRDVLSAIKDWECSGSIAQADPVCILFLGEVEWLKAYFERRDELLYSKSRPSICIFNDPSKEVASWQDNFSRYGLPLLHRLSDLDRISAFLQNELDLYPDKTSGFIFGPGSASRHIYAGVLLYLLGRIKEANEELDIEESRAKAQLAQNQYFKIGYEATICKIERLRTLINF